MNRALHRPVGGFSLMEMVMVIAIMGVIAAAASLFIVGPVQGYVSASTRSAMADIADTALRRIARDVRLALPNSVRTNGLYLEFVPVKTAGRYFQTYGGLWSDNCFTSGGNCANLVVTGDVLSGSSIANSDLVIVYNQYNNDANNCSPSNPSVYCNVVAGGARTLTSASTTGGAAPVTTLGPFSDQSVFRPHGGSPSRRVFVVASSPVTYACDATTNTLWRISGYALQPEQPVNAAAPPLSTATTREPLATHVACLATPPRFAYISGVSQRYGLLSAWITVQAEDENVSLLHQVHVDNTP